MATTAATGTTDAQKEIGTGHTGIRPLDYSAGGRATLESFLKSVPLLSLSRPHSTVVCLHDRDTLPHALATLGDHSFLSAPVLNDLGASVGMVSVNDLAAALVTVADAALQDAGQADIRLQRLQELWGGHLVGQVMNISDRSPLVPLPHDASLWDGLERLAKGGAHSVVVMRADGSAPEALYSQGAVLGYLFHHLHHFSSIARMMVQQVANFSQVGSPHPLHVAEDVPLLEAFRVIREQAVTGVMVVSRGRKVVGVISATDVRMLGPNMERGELLFASAGNFVRQVQQQNPLLLSKVVSCTPVDTVGMVMEKMMDNAVHRVFVVRTHHGLEEDVPLDVLAMRDILLLFQPDA